MPKKFKFTLQVVLELAAEKRDEEARTLKTRCEALDAAREKRAEVHRRRDGLVAERDAVRSAPFRSVADLEMLGSREQALQETIAECEVECARAEEKVREEEGLVAYQRGELAAAFAKLTQFERLRERELAEFNARERRKEEAERDEDTILRHRPVRPEEDGSHG